MCATPWAIWGTWYFAFVFISGRISSNLVNNVCAYLEQCPPPPSPSLRHESVAHVSGGCHHLFRSPMLSHSLSLSFPLSFPPATTAEAVEKILSHCSKSVWKLPAVKHILLARIALWIIQNIRIFRLSISFGCARVCACLFCLFLCRITMSAEAEENPKMWIIMQISRQNESKSNIDFYILRYL